MTSTDIARAVEIATAIRALPEDMPELEAQEAIVNLFGVGDIGAFLFMDEKPGHGCFWELRDERNGYSVWHSRLRRVRNNPNNNLFERMK